MVCLSVVPFDALAYQIKNPLASALSDQEVHFNSDGMFEFLGRKIE